MKRAEILVNGLVQGVGFRYFVVKRAEELGLKGYTKNIFSGEVYIIVEGERTMIEDFFNRIKIGPVHSNVKNASIKWSESKNEFIRFEVRY
jgi:acylphosphatase